MRWLSRLGNMLSHIQRGGDQNDGTLDDRHDGRLGFGAAPRISPFFNLRSKYVLLSCGYIAKKKNGENLILHRKKEATHGAEKLAENSRNLS